MKNSHSKIKIRKFWGQTNPVTRRLESKVLYRRKHKFGDNNE